MFGDICGEYEKAHIKMPTRGESAADDDVAPEGAASDGSDGGARRHDRARTEADRHDHTG
jgi:hypothetical protein